MNEVVELVKQKTGLSDEMAQKAVTTVVEYIKGKLPAGMASQLDGLMAGGRAEGGGEGLVDRAKSFMSSFGTSKE